MARRKKLYRIVQEASGEPCDVAISGLRFDDTRLPDVSLSPAMTVVGPDASHNIERV